MRCRGAFAVALALATVLHSACGPIPGGSLKGTLAPPPAQWAKVLDGDGGVCEVESRPEDPHSVQLYCFLYEGALYAQSHRWALAWWWPTESWPLVWMGHPNVKVRIGASLFELTAVYVTSDEERTPVMASVGYEPPPEGIALFRFDPRQ